MDTLIEFLFLGLRGQSQTTIDEILDKESPRVKEFLKKALKEAEKETIPWFYTPIQSKTWKLGNILIKKEANMRKWLNWLLLSMFLFLLTSCTPGEIGALLIVVIILVVLAIVGLVLIYLHNKDKIGKAIGIAQEIKDTITKPK